MWPIAAISRWWQSFSSWEPSGHACYCGRFSPNLRPLKLERGRARNGVVGKEITCPPPTLSIPPTGCARGLDAICPTEELRLSTISLAKSLATSCRQRDPTIAIPGQTSRYDDHEDQSDVTRVSVANTLALRNAIGPGIPTLTRVGQRAAENPF